ncbi:succinate dehydrogenase, hydrophobic membrane anchor protein [Actibacterium atlanticum]|uniref:Succinate dehydrogenase hydrophobic membrane anchor subunit n=1 Tax=Actibacterium atlanticum TaxID=1461693 RepID=A0A058ZJ07_9RHOB|nr:succinate dehydrogenase, hydrophobic membrane anchor protein [Actibacterium atlanticum]KCV81609.1 succinate dehydrogenase, hydrophobic membrane anchor protein [Actibacterium atlanticum]
MQYLTDRKRAQGLGAGGAGAHHHWVEIATSIALLFIVPLAIFVFGFGMGGTREEVLAYFAHPFVAIVLSICLIIGIYHIKLETLAAVEDYVHGIKGKLTQIAVTGFSYVLIGTGLFAIARIAF